MALVEVSLDWSFFLQLANFLVLLYLLNRLLIKPVLGNIKKRDEIVEGDLKEAEGKEEEAAELFRRHERIISNAQKEIMNRLTRTRKEAEGRQNELIQRARGEANAHIERARAEIRSEAEAARGQLRAEAERLSATIAERILGRPVLEG